MRALFSLLTLLFTLTVSAQSDTTTVETTAEEVPAVAMDEAAQWDAANTAYINGDYAHAIELYEAILRSNRHSAKLYYNLGNAYYKQEELGRAILNYRRALRLAPGDADARYNLSVAESRTKDTIQSIPEFFLTTWMRSLRHTISSNGWTVIALVMLVVTAALVLFYLLSRRLVLRKVGFYGMLVALLLTLLAAWCADASRHELIDGNEAVVMSRSTSVKASPDNGATDLFVLHEGTVVKISERLGNWCEITIADGKKGWLPMSRIEVI